MAKTGKEGGITHDAVKVGILLSAFFAIVLFARNDKEEFRSVPKAALGKAQLKKSTGFETVEDYYDRAKANLREFYHPTGKIEDGMNAVSKRN